MSRLSFRALTTLTAALSACLLLAGPLRADSYLYDELGNVRSRSNDRGTVTYTYDEINRLQNESGYTGTRAHTYDANTNRTSNGAPTGMTTATFAANSNRLATINGVAVTLDAAGNLTQEGSYTYGWNEAGLLQTVSKAGSLVATYTYDHRNRRTRKVTTPAAPQGAQTVVYHYDQADRLIGETRGDGTPLRTYVWLEERPMVVMEHAALSTPPRTLYLQRDHLDTPRLAKDAAGTIHWRWDSDGYGSAAATEDPDGNGKVTVINLRFPGQYYDQESGLHYNWNRYYSPRMGRYISSDPIGIEGGGNSYSYVNGNPLSYTDPEGLQATAVLGGFGGGSSAAGAGATAGLGAGAAVAGAGLAGYGLGTLIYPYIEPAVSKAVDWCMSSNSKQECLDNCYAAYLNQVRICKMSPTAKGREQCYARASDLHGQCRAACK
ncbi:RHS repeat-associated core domain-containing protein [Zoogloea sp.]|uniref:RHS repeat-associated core domain-containing protein n=1 Tax=Zoogloea sp. TaxID=49181 RepID=UPI0025DFD1AD|nr:RHS repeat-associated core domain-containing protein [Zoogloea sp.]